MMIDTSPPHSASNGSDRRHRSALIHIGLPKTGTTTIQRFLANNVDALASQGIHTQDPMEFPTWWANAHAGSALVVLSKLQKKATNAVLCQRLGIKTLDDQKVLANEYETKFRAFVETRGTGRFVMSGESMFNLLTRPRHIKALDAFYAEFFAHRQYVVYLRNPVDWVASQYSQVVSVGLTTRLEDMVSKLSRQDQYARISQWDDLLPEAGLTVRLMSKDTLKDGNIISDFCALMGCEADNLNIPPNRNVSPSARHLRLLEMVNRLGIHRGGSKALNFASKHGLLGRSGKYRLPEEQRRQVEDMFAASNEKLRARYFPHKAGLFDPEPTEHAAGAPKTAGVMS